MSWFYRHVARPLLFAQDSEVAHDRTLRGLALAGRSRFLCALTEALCDVPDLPVTRFGLRFPNPVGLAAGMIALMFAATLVVNGGILPRPAGTGDFYAVVPHDVMIALFGGVFLFAIAAIWIGARRFWRDMEGAAEPARGFDAIIRALRDVLTLRHLHGSGENCTSAEERRTPWRRWSHHCTFYGFLFCLSHCIRLEGALCVHQPASDPRDHRRCGAPGGFGRPSDAATPA